MAWNGAWIEAWNGVFAAGGHRSYDRTGRAKGLGSSWLGLRPSRLGTLALALTGLVLMPGLGWAQSLSSEEQEIFLADPEFAEPRDPLLPTFVVPRPLSPLEKRELGMALDRLAVEAGQLYDMGEMDEAFELWMREVRLRRILGLEPELAAIRRVGLRAWEASRTPEAQLLTLRLDEIQAEVLAQPTPPLNLVVALAASYETLRAVDAAIAVYETLRVRAAQSGDLLLQLRLLDRIGQLQADWFRFEAAAETYRRILVLTEGQRLAPAQRADYFKRAIENFEQAEQRETAILLQRQLLRHYQDLGQEREIAPLQLAIARNYRAIGRADLALDFYQSAYRLALDLDQSLYARDVVADLATIYRDLDRPEDVLYLYDQQLAVERLSYSGYGIMTVFDQLGQFYEAQEEPESAIAAYREGLIMAHHLGHRRTYFETQIRRIQIAQGTITISPIDDHVADPAVGPLSAPFTWQENSRP